LPRIYEYVAGMRAVNLETLKQIVGENFESFFNR